MIELLLILCILGVGAFWVWLATDIFVNEFLCAIFGIAGAGVIIYGLLWMLRWFVLGGLLA